MVLEVHLVAVVPVAVQETLLAEPVAPEPGVKSGFGVGKWVGFF